MLPADFTGEFTLKLPSINTRDEFGVVWDSFWRLDFNIRSERFFRTLLGGGNFPSYHSHGLPIPVSNHAWSGGDAAQFTRSSPPSSVGDGHDLITAVFVEKAGILLRGVAQHACRA